MQIFDYLNNLIITMKIITLNDKIYLKYLTKRDDIK